MGKFCALKWVIVLYRIQLWGLSRLGSQSEAFSENRSGEIFGTAQMSLFVVGWVGCGAIGGNVMAENAGVGAGTFVTLVRIYLSYYLIGRRVGRMDTQLGIHRVIQIHVEEYDTL